MSDPKPADGAGAAGANPPANPPADPPKDQAKDQAKKKKARVLVATTVNGKAVEPNDVVSVDDATLASHKGELDATPASVKYAESLRKGAATEEEEA